MDRQKRALKIQKILNKLFPNPPIPLQHTTPYTLMVSVLLSARCTDARVNTITPALFNLADTPEKMMHLSVEEVQAIIRPCGLSPFKARAIVELSHILMEKYGGEVPPHFEDLESLPGIGHKSASVVMCQAFGQPAFPVDTHIHRCAKRWGLSNGRSTIQTERDLKSLFPEEDWCRLHLQIIYFARKFCPAVKHDSAKCPICSWISL